MTIEEFDKLKIGDKVYTANWDDPEGKVVVLYGEIKSLASEYNTGRLKTDKGMYPISNGSVFFSRAEAVKNAVECLNMDIEDQKRYIEVCKKRIIEAEKNIKELTGK